MVTGNVTDNDTDNGARNRQKRSNGEKTILRSVETQSYQPSKSNNGPLWQIIFRRYKNKKERKVL